MRQMVVYKRCKNKEKIIKPSAPKRGRGRYGDGRWREVPIEKL